jgi:hypothetical protein
MMSKKIAGSEKIARYLNLGQPNYAELVNEPDEDETKDAIGSITVEGINSRHQVNDSSALGGVSDFGVAVDSHSEVIGEDNVEITHIKEEDTEETSANSLVSKKNDNKKPQSGAKAIAKKKSNTDKNKSIKTDKKSKSNADTYNLDGDELNTNMWSVDYDLPM